MPGASLATASRDSGSSSLRFRRTCIALCSFHDGLTSLRLDPPPGQPTTAGGLPSHIPTIEPAPLPGTKERGRGIQETSIPVPKTRLPPPDTTRGSWTTYFVSLRRRPAPLHHVGSHPHGQRASPSGLRRGLPIQLSANGSASIGRGCRCLLCLIARSTPARGGQRFSRNVTPARPGASGAVAQNQAFVERIKEFCR